MPRIFIFITACVLTSFSVNAQSASDSVRLTINNLFKAMKNADTALLRSSFADSAIMQTIQHRKDGSVNISNENVSEFIDFLAKETPGAADERISFKTVETDGELAIAWTPYQFFYKGKFSHCGVNSFQLVRIAGSWKIQYIIDTRRKTACN